MLTGPNVVQQVNVPQETNASAWRTFKPQTNYILDVYAGNPLVNAVWIQLQPLMNPLWMESMIHRAIKEKNLEKIMGLILEESSGRNPLHQRRIELMQVKKTGSHSDFFFQLEQHMSLIEFDKLTKEALLTHLFLEQSDETIDEWPKTCVQNTRRRC